MKKAYNNSALEESLKISIIGLGYVGLPLALEFSKTRKVVAFDINQKRIDDLKKGLDITKAVDEKILLEAESILFTDDSEDLKLSNCYIVTVPTPVDKDKLPDLSFLIQASQLIGSLLKKGDLVIYESTVYPGCTEEVCIPILIESSELNLNKDFMVGYSPERVNPGDKDRSIRDIVKVTSGSSKYAEDLVASLYETIIDAGIYRAESIMIAETAKVIENTQRDLNIALANEFAIIFSKLGLNTKSVLNAASTKWNFLNFSPGLVGGHCISVDPYYLTYKSKQLNYNPKVILAGREVNNNIVSHISKETINLIKKNGFEKSKGKILILGFTFKENCPDIRNSRVADLVKNFEKKNFDVDVFDPYVENEEIISDYGIKALEKEPKAGMYDAVVVAVAHDYFVKAGIENIRSFCNKNGILYDVKSIFDSKLVDGSL